LVSKNAILSLKITCTESLLNKNKLAYLVLQYSCTNTALSFYEPDLLLFTLLPKVYKILIFFLISSYSGIFSWEYITY
jgi:hypothetical protein